MTDNEKAGYAEMFREMSHEELVKVALELLDDTERLRRELDEAQGVIR